LNLEANQQGQLTAQQKDWLKQDMKQERQRQYRLIYASFAVFLIIAMIVILMPSLPIPIVAVPLVWGIGIASWYGYIWMQQKPIRDDLDAGTVQAITGYVDKHKEEGYCITVSGVSYAVHPDMYPIFDETERYTIYVIPYSKIVLSAEIITETSDYIADEEDKQKDASQSRHR